MIKEDSLAEEKSIINSRKCISTLNTLITLKWVRNVWKLKFMESNLGEF